MSVRLIIFILEAKLYLLYIIEYFNVKIRGDLCTIVLVITTYLL